MNDPSEEIIPQKETLSQTTIIQLRQPVCPLGVRELRRVSGDHIGIVEKCENGMVYTIEGNVNNDCAQGRYYVGDTCIFGYGLPAY